MKLPQQRAVIADADRELFRNTVGPVMPLSQQNRVVLRAPPPQFRGLRQVQGEICRDTLSDHMDGMAPEHYLTNGLSSKTLRKLRRGEWPIGDKLDLHGLSIENARPLLHHFLLLAQQQHYRCVLIIHGKGLNSHQNKAVLRELSRHWLIQHPAVLAYCHAPLHLGGDGAVLALLKMPFNDGE